MLTSNEAQFDSDNPINGFIQLLNFRLPAPAVASPDSLFEHYAALLDRIMSRSDLHPRKSLAVGVTSCQSGEGVTTICANLAHVAAAQAERPVLLVDANFARPKIEKIYPAAAAPGLAELIEGDAELADCIRRVPGSDVSILPAGHIERCRRAKLTSAGLSPIIPQLKRQFGLILFDLPAASAASPCLAVAHLLDAVTLVVEAERTRNQVVARAKKLLEEGEAKLAGVVLNRRRTHLPDWLYKRL